MGLGGGGGQLFNLCRSTTDFNLLRGYPSTLLCVLVEKKRERERKKNREMERKKGKIERGGEVRKRTEERERESFFEIEREH